MRGPFRFQRPTEYGLDFIACRARVFLIEIDMTMGVGEVYSGFHTFDAFDLSRPVTPGFCMLT